MKRRLGVNIDHIATIRESRKVSYPNPLHALSILKDCHVDQVTLHLREDRRHIQDEDLVAIIKARVLPVNLEMAVTDEMIGIASHHKPKNATFVPEKREEVTTEGGLDCVQNMPRIQSAIKTLHDHGIFCSLFIDPEADQVAAAKEVGADAIEIHTGTYCNATDKVRAKEEVEKIRKAAHQAHDSGLEVYAGHGLHCDNLAPIVAIEVIKEYNIGHSIIARAVFVGLKEAVREIQRALNVS